MSAEKSLNSSLLNGDLKVCQRGGAWPRLTVPLFRPPLSRSLSPSSIVGRLKPMRLLVVVSLQMGIAESGEDEASGSGYQMRVALEVFGNHERPHIHAAVEELTEGVGAGQKLCDEGVQAGYAQ